MTITQPSERQRLTTLAQQIETEARQRWAAGAAEAARQRRERHMEQLRMARVSLWGPYPSDDETDWQEEYAAWLDARNEETD